MVGTVEQLIALVAYGNAYLNNGYNLENFYPDHSVFQICNALIFVDVKKFLRVTESPVAENPNQWLSWLKENGCRRLYIGYEPTPAPQLPDYLSAAFVGGGGTWYVASVFSKSADYWLNRWEVTDLKAADNKIWKVTYGRVATKKPLPEFTGRELTSCKTEFESILKQIEAFALRHDLDYFAKCFRDSLVALSSDDAMNSGYHKDLLPDAGFSLEAKQLIAASSLAWVFGGMGSWNDLGFDGGEQREYERLSKELYSIINLSVERSVNSSV